MSDSKRTAQFDVLMEYVKATPPPILPSMLLAQAKLEIEALSPRAPFLGAACQPRAPHGYRAGDMARRHAGFRAARTIDRRRARLVEILGRGAA